MRAVVFINGSRESNWNWQAQLKPDDLLVAADAGATWLLQIGKIPHWIVGDFDSMPLWAYSPEVLQKTRLVKHPTDKDATDLELALLLAKEQGATQILLLGLLGGRWDHSLANVMLLANPAFSDLEIMALQPGQALRIIHPHQPQQFNGRAGDILSLVPFGGDVQGIQLTGTRWQLYGENLPMGSSRGVSNEIVEGLVSISITSGVLLCIHIWKSDL
ncbi:MAG TPA: thiamine diphosphokinase [Anaerolineales bacterium]|nr:thiamine diphosphokinase [Anaerolineales bacterium]